MARSKDPPVGDDDAGIELGFEPDAALGISFEDAAHGIHIDRLETPATVDSIEPIVDDDGEVRYHIVVRAELSEAAAKAMFAYCVRRGRVRLEILPGDEEDDFFEVSA